MAIINDMSTRRSTFMTQMIPIGSLLVFIVFCYIMYYFNLLNIRKDSNYSVFIIISAFIGSMLLLEVFRTMGNPKYFKVSETSFGYSNVLKLMSSFGGSVTSFFVVVMIVVFLLYYFYNVRVFSNVDSLSDMVLVLIYIVMILVGLSLFSQILGMTGDENRYIKIFKQILFYLPCLFTELLYGVIREMKMTPPYVLFLLSLEVLLVGTAFMIQRYKPHLLLHDGQILVENPVKLNVATSSSSLNGLTYNGLVKTRMKLDENGRIKNKSDLINDLNYSISFWTYLNPSTTQTSNHDGYDTIFTLGDRPIVEYSQNKNKIRVKCKQETVAMIDEVPLQRWNHVAVNYSFNQMDVFFNGVLVKSQKISINALNADEQIVRIGNNPPNPYFYGNLTSLVYYNRLLNASEIKNIYNYGRIKSVPTI